MASSQSVPRKRKLPAWMKLKTETKSAQTGLSNGVTKSSVLEDSLPELRFTGGIIYSHRKDDCSLLCQDIICSLETQQHNAAVGFDIEWPVTYQRGREDRTALVQICTPEKCCYLFHVSCMGELPKGLKELLSHSKIKKVGVGIDSDLWKLERDFDIRVKEIIDGSTIDLSVMANRVVNSSQTWSLDGLTRYLLRQKLCKDPSVRKSDWRQFPLSSRQQMYAATDAYVGKLDTI
ncbi:Werner syndrome ATP-dependent helicase isoform X2 [Lingula anatina]|uniref:3'-5' exonuclease n=1 Tax=Lingula anatina TaxID=7574 RepID=A0A1S3K9I7_LINAN|nr:Werner syndrome ATP-dependent helicase isoform X2 [Lingula anatina]|eukprot:XP_013418921.1 Werner syndrome ATP-dependent helicase isoform X2 [Lingula anatina]